jgi:signal transduction histidine kinase
MRLSLRHRLLIPPAVLLVGTAAATWWAATHAAAAVERQIADKISAVGRSVVGPPTFRLTDPILRQMRELTGVELVLVQPAREAVSTLDPPPPDLTADVVRANGREFRLSKIPIRPPHPNEGGTLYALYPEAQRRAAVREAVQPALWLGVVGGLVTFALLFVTSRRLVARIRAVESRTRDIADGRLEPIPLPAADDEVRDLVVSVNEMSRKLAEYQTALRQTERLRVLGQFSGGLAHQLRNAAGGARLAVQLYLNESPPGDVEPLNVALRQLARMETNLRQFLDLGRPDDHTLEPLDLVAVLDQAVESLTPQARHTGTKLVWAKPAHAVPMTGNAVQLGHVFTNLLSNAVEAAGPGGAVELKVDISPAGVRITFSDTGPGPPPAIAARLFDTFVTGKEHGVGLGLAVAKQAVDLHRGRIFWERIEDRTHFVVELKQIAEAG